MRQFFTGARLFDGERMIEGHALLVENDLIVGLTRSTERPEGFERRDLGGGVLAPGLIDWQVNGGGGVLFNDAPTLAGVKTIVEAHRSDGTTSLLPTVVTGSRETLEAALSAAAAAHDSVPGALGIHVEGPFIDVRRKGAHPPAFIRTMTGDDADRLIAAKRGAMVVTLAPSSVAADLIVRLVQAGIIVSIGHSDATAEETQAAFRAGASAVTHLYNAMSQLAHRRPGVVGAALADPDIFCGFIADGHHVHEAAARVALKAKGADGVALVSDAMPPAAGGPKTFLLEGRRATLVGTKLTLADGTLAGAAITLMDAVRYTTRTLGVDLADALKMATLTPARLLRLDDRIGRLKPKFRADLVHIGDDLSMKGVWIGGERRVGTAP